MSWYSKICPEVINKMAFEEVKTSTVAKVAERPWYFWEEYTVHLCVTVIIVCWLITRPRWMGVYMCLCGVEGMHWQFLCADATFPDVLHQDLVICH